MILEFKDVNLSAGEEQSVSGLSFTVGAGEVVGLAGSSVSVRDRLLEAALGLQPVTGGYVSIDGEWIRPGAAQYFRRQTAYIPRDLRLPYPTVAEMTEQLAGLRANRPGSYTKEKLQAEWERLGIDPKIADLPLNEVNGFVVRLVLLTVMKLSDKPFLIVAEPLSFDRNGLIMTLLHDAAERGTAVLLTGTPEELDGNCDRIIVIH